MNDATTPTADYDSPWKEALARYLPDAFALFFPDAHAQVAWERGYERAQILELFRLIDWLVALPREQEAALWREIAHMEEEKRMPYITSVERIGLREGELRGQRSMLRRLLQARFGTVPEGLGRQIDDADQGLLDQLADRIGAASSLHELDPEANQSR